MTDIWTLLFGAVTWGATLRMATPILLTAIGGSFSRKTGTFCIAFECFMLSSAFFAALGSFLTQNPYVGGLFAMAAGLVLAAVYGLFVFHLHANAMIVSIALNFGAWAVTTLLLTEVFGVRGYFFSPSIISFPPINLPFLNNIPILNDVLNNNNILVYLAYLSVVVGYIVMYRTPFGLRLRGVGSSPSGAQTAGVNLLRYRWVTLLIMGAMSGLGGAYLPLSGLNTFSENMTSGRGFLAFAAILVGRGNPLKVAPVCLLFAYTDALNMTLTASGLPIQILQMLPYIMVILVLLMAGLRNFDGTVKLRDEEKV